MKVKQYRFILFGLPAVCASGFAFYGYATTSSQAMFGRGGAAMFCAIFGGIYGAALMTLGLIGLWFKNNRCTSYLQNRTRASCVSWSIILGIIPAIITFIYFEVESNPGEDRDVPELMIYLLVTFVSGAFVGLIVANTESRQY